MAEQPKGKIGETIEAVEGLIKAVPVYRDLVQPAAIEAGLALKTVVKLVHVALAPVSGLVWSYDRLSQFLESKVAPKLTDVPANQITCPPADVAVPLLESVCLKGESPELVELYAQLLASAMQQRDDRLPHPAFVEVLKQLSPDDAKVLRILYLKSATPYLVLEHTDDEDRIAIIDHCFTQLSEEAGISSKTTVAVALDNLERLGLIDLLSGSELPDTSLYEDLELLAGNGAQYRDTRMAVPPNAVRTSRGTILLREFGASFCKSCMDGVGGNRRIGLKIISETAAPTTDAAYAVVIVPKIASLRRSGLTELISDIRVRIIGTPSATDRLSIKLFLNTNLTSRMINDPWSEAAIFAGPTRRLIANGRNGGANSVVFLDIPFDELAGLPVAQRYFTISGIRCNANQLGFGGGGKGVELFIEISGIEVRASSSHVVGQMIDSLRVTAHCDP